MAANALGRGKKPPLTYQRHQQGGAAEYYAASRFLQKGYQVWWPSIQSSKSDFAISKASTFQRVQVKKAGWKRSGGKGRKNDYLSASLRRGNKHLLYERGDFDLFVVVEDGLRAWSIPHEELPKGTGIVLDKRGPTVREGVGAWDRWLLR